MKKILYGVVIFFIIILIFSFVYIVRTSNIIFGSNSYYYKDIFDYPDSEWYCEQAGMELKVYDLQKSHYPEYEYLGYPCFAILKTSIGEEYVVIGDRGSITIYKQEYADKSIVFSGFAKYKKSFFTKEIEAFTVYDIREDKILNNKYDKLKFYKK